MARPVRPELLAADIEARRYFNSQMHEYRRIGHPRMASFAKEMSRGTIAPIPTPDDPELDWVGAWFFGLERQVHRQLFAARYCQLPPYSSPRAIARSMGISEDKLHRIWERLLEQLTGYLKAHHDMEKPQ